MIQLAIFWLCFATIGCYFICEIIFLLKEKCLPSNFFDINFQFVYQVLPLCIFVSFNGMFSNAYLKFTYSIVVFMLNILENDNESAPQNDDAWSFDKYDLCC